MIRFLTCRLDDIPGTRSEREAAAKARLLCELLGPEARIEHYDDGAPYVAGRPDLCVSVSHSLEMCAMVVADQPVGIDVETLRPQLERVSRKFVAPGEEAADLETLRRLWMAKEAVYKLMRTPGLALTDIRVQGSTATAPGRNIRLLQLHDLTIATFA